MQISKQSQAYVLKKQRNQGSRECFLLRIARLNIQESCGLSAGRVKTQIIMKNNDINIQQIRSCDNLVDFSTKLLPSRIFGQLVQKIDIHRPRDGCMVEGEK
jgi:hypothetical protein